MSDTDLLARKHGKEIYVMDDCIERLRANEANATKKMNSVDIFDMMNWPEIRANRKSHGITIKAKGC